MKDAILTLNAGSSSIKFALYELSDPIPEQAELTGQIDGIGARPHIKARDKSGQALDDVDIPLAGDADAQHHAAVEFLVQWLHGHEAGWRIAGVGHRVVHGADRYSRPLLLDDENIAVLQGFIPLAPLHQPHNLDGIAALRACLPEIPQVACFDTAFHTTQPPVATRYALPRRISDLGVKRYGFHGLSYEYIAETLPQYLDNQARGRVIVAHLGNGSSLCAMKDGRSIATTMGFTAIEGLMMGTRTGSIDPGVLLYLMEFQDMDAAALTRLLYKESGLLGVSGISQDMRTLLVSEAPEAREAVDLFCYRIVREIGSLVAALGGLDVLVFTAGIGEHAAPVRQQVCSALSWLGMELDPAANAADARCISLVGSATPVLVLPTNEEWMIARHTAERIARPPVS
ncbi:acetate/propionate family kinase [Denitratisoma oestradiolicum]|uniref:Acetate kinase n=1 Tax=Denitratisoma oestradiolicum TaxID=311182 RepID=A0A6S6XZ32_9PROT|nr:acetate/propionate family kinase [Denitratisoma oestradiolicum]TWO78891.1 acetate kinase [Denitratisoma oestradiolicum]CAB1369441.1 Acetate kinase [Denitratisoma oestradiolicum]